MGSTVKKIALLSGGGDCPGLNAVIRTITKTAISKYGYEVIGFVYGYRGLYHNNYVELTEESVEDIYKEGGTILYSSNKDNLFDYLVDDGHGGKVKKDVSDVAVENLKKDGVDVAISKVWEKGADGGIELAEKLLNILETKEANYHPLYDLDLSIEEKIETIVKEIYGGDGVEFTKKAKNKIKKYTEQGLSQLPICVAKTQYSLSDQASLLGRPTGFTVKINDIIPSAGAGFLVAISGDIMRMPGLPKRPAAVNMDIDEDGKIIGLF